MTIQCSRVRPRTLTLSVSVPSNEIQLFLQTPYTLRLVGWDRIFTLRRKASFLTQALNKTCPRPSRAADSAQLMTLCAVVISSRVLLAVQDRPQHWKTSADDAKRDLHRVQNLEHVSACVRIRWRRGIDPRWELPGQNPDQGETASAGHNSYTSVSGPSSSGRERDQSHMLGHLHEANRESRHQPDLPTPVAHLERPE